eukprot:4418533-Amphidinium_carterae.1
MNHLQQLCVVVDVKCRLTSLIHHIQIGGSTFTEPILPIASAAAQELPRPQYGGASMGPFLHAEVPNMARQVLRVAN